MQDAFFYFTTFIMLFGVVASLTLAYRQQHYPREVFAFYAVLGWMGWLGWSCCRGEESEDRGIFDSYQEHYLFYLLLTIVIWLAITFFWYKKMTHTHHCWDDTLLTMLDFGRRQRQEKVSIFRNAWEQFLVIINLEWSLPLYETPPPKAIANVVEPIDSTSVPWRVQALEILQLLDHQYKAHQIDDWYSDEECYLCNYGKAEYATAIFCNATKPDKDAIINLLNFITSRKQTCKRILILIEQGQGTKQEELMGSIQVIFRYKQEMLDALVDFSAYFEELDNRFSSRPIYMGSKKTLADIYTPLSAHFKDSLIPNVEQYALDWAKADNPCRHLAIMGQYGQGKSVLALKFCVTQCRRQGRIPILLELRGKSPRNMAIEDLLFTWAKKYNINTKALLQLHQEGRLILVLDGFDEMDLIGDYTMRLAHFRKLWKLAQAPRAKLLFTGRANYFATPSEQQQALGIRALPTLNYPYCEALYLQLFSLEQIERSLRHTEAAVRQSILTLLKRQHPTTQRLYDLLARPVTLSLVTIIWNKSDFEQYQQQLTSTLVLQEYLQFAYKRQLQKNLLHPLSLIERQYFMMGIAVAMMQQEGVSNRISQQELEYWIEQLLNHLPAALSNLSSELETMRGDLKERFYKDGTLPAEAKATIVTDIRTCGILVQDNSHKGHFKFAHQSFLEYLVGEYFFGLLCLPKTSKKEKLPLMVQGIQAAIPQANLSSSPEIFQFVGGLVVHYQTLPENPYSAAQQLQHFLNLNKVSLLLGFMKNKFYWTPIFFIVVLFISFFISFVIVETIIRVLADFEDATESNLALFSFYLLLFLFYQQINRYLHLRGRDALLKAQVWYKACQVRQINRAAMNSVLGSSTLNYLERHLQ